MTVAGRTAPSASRFSAPAWAWRLLALAALIASVVIATHSPIEAVAAVGIVVMLALSYANGANDVAKSVATLVGSGVTNYRRAMLWGALWTGIGSALSAVAARALLATFSRGFTTSGAPLGAKAALAVLTAALVWVLLATSTGLPVSTTHAIAGAVAGVAVAAVGVGGVDSGALMHKIGLPLALSPLLAVGLAVAVYMLLRALPSRLNLTALHWLSSGFVGLARGLNDTPKIVAVGTGLGLASSGARTPEWVFIMVTVAMVLGSWIGGYRVTKTLAEKVVRLGDREGLGANLATAILVGVASNVGLPVSTTHVSSAAIVGVGARHGPGAVRWRTVADMGIAWLVTIPVAALLAASLYVLSVR